jgi:hypothetical protein
VLSASEAADLTHAATIRSVGKGQPLFRAGDAGAALFIVLSGSFDVVLSQGGAADTVVASLGPGQIVGEIEVMTQSARVASLIANEDASVLELAASRFQTMLDESRPVAVKVVTTIAKTLARRLAAVNQRVVSRAAATPMPARPAVAAPPPPARAAAPAAPRPAGPFSAPRPPPGPGGAKLPDPPPPAPVAATAPPAPVEELPDAEVAAIDDDDMAVLDKLWG